MDETKSVERDLMAGIATAKAKAFMNVSWWVWLWSSSLRLQFPACLFISLSGNTVNAQGTLRCVTK